MGKSLKNEIINLRKGGFSYDEIASRLNCSKATISYHCKNAGFGSKISVATENEIENMQNYYNECKSSLKVAEKFGRSKTFVLNHIKIEPVEKKSEDQFKKDRSEAVVNWRKRTKERLVEYKGGKCQCCGYDNCIEALEFHHTDPNEKDFGISGKSWAFEKLKIEVDKCIMVCSNCHKEIHAGIRTFND